MSVCDKHRAAPAMIYHACIGCEVESLRAEVEQLRAKLASAKSASKVAETRMVADSPASARLAAPAVGSAHGCHWPDCPHGYECIHAKPSTAPAAGTVEKDAERLLTAIVRSDVGIATRHKLEDGQGMQTGDGKNWLAAIEFVAAIEAKEPPCGS